MRDLLIILFLIFPFWLIFSSSYSIARGYYHNHYSYHSPSYHSYISHYHSYSSLQYTPRKSRTKDYSPHPNDHYTSSYTRRDGTSVRSYHATNPDSTPSNNYSTAGNINPYTLKAGTQYQKY